MVDTEDGQSSTWCRLASPLSHYLSLRWFRSHVVVLGVRPQLGQAAVLRELCVSVAALSHPSAGAEAGARIASRACVLRVPLLAASGGGLVVVVVTAFLTTFLSVICCPSLHGGYSLAVPSFCGRHWSGLVWTRASGGSRSVSSRYRSSVLGCQSVVAPACMASQPCGVPGVRGGSACGPSTLWRSEVAVLTVRRCSHLVVVWSRRAFRGLLPLRARLRWFLRESCVWPDLGWWSWRCDVLFRYFVVPCYRVPAALAGEGLLIPTGPCSQGSPPYFLQLGARRRGSSVSDRLRRRSRLLVLLAAVRASVTISSNPSGSSDPWVAVRPSGPLARVREVGSLQWYQSEESTEICKELITIAVPKKASLQGSCACCRLQLLLCPVRGEYGRSACSCHSGAVGTGLVGSGLPCVEDTCRQVQAWCSWSSSARLSVCASRRLRESACGVAFTSAGLLPMELVEGVLALLATPLLLGLRSAIGLAGVFWRVLPERCLGGSGRGSPRTGLRCFCSSACCSVLSDGQCCFVVGLCILVKIFPRIALCRFWWRFFPGVLCVCFGPPLCCPCGSKCAVRLGCILVRFSQDGSWRFWWRFSPKLFHVVLVVASLSLCRDELSSLPVFLVKALCTWPCVWLLHWPSCLVVHFQVFSAVLVGLCVSPWLEWFASFLTSCALTQMVV
ncbi:hypothetical protein Taro_026071 [Colocasia esculenta]|uniref:Uncharacterized protein n=1 Tax=Colocasia esculenta TaxID=4460 RepID=A0A843VE46_COLES|nr:hypothetical protein [Colocasia esculenta]